MRNEEIQRKNRGAAKPLRSLRRCGEKTTVFWRHGGIQERGNEEVLRKSKGKNRGVHERGGEETTNEEIQRKNKGRNRGNTGTRKYRENGGAAKTLRGS